MRSDPPEFEDSTLLGVRLETERMFGRAYTAYPNLARVRWLLPANQPALRRAGIGGLYQPGSLRGRVLGRLIDAGALQGEKVWLEEDALARLESTLVPILGEEDVRLAFYVGVPAPHRKVTAQVLTPDGKTLAYAKIATSPLAQEAVETERRTLLRLAESEGLRGSVPEVLGWFGWQGGSTLLITMGPPRPGPRRLSPAHSDFCARVFHSFEEQKIFARSPMWARMSETWLRLQHSPSEALPVRLGLALERLHDELGPVLIPFSLAHGDFAPWNTRVGPRSLFVFDWERATGGMIPLYDVFNFQALQAALQGQRRVVPDRRFLLTVSDNLWPGGQRHLPMLYLAYLVHVFLLYSEAQSLAPGVGERRVWHWFAKRIEDFLSGGMPL